MTYAFSVFLLVGIRLLDGIHLQSFLPVFSICFWLDLVASVIKDPSFISSIPFDCSKWFLWCCGERHRYKVTPSLIGWAQHVFSRYISCFRRGGSLLVFLRIGRGWFWVLHWRYCRIYSFHYNYVMMNDTASQITGLTIVCSTVYSSADQRKHQSSASLAFGRGIHWWPVNSPHKRPVVYEADVVHPQLWGYVYSLLFQWFLGLLIVCLKTIRWPTVEHPDLPPAWALVIHDDVIKWKHFRVNWPFVRGIHWSPVDSHHKGQKRRALMFSLICEQTIEVIWDVIALIMTSL